MFTFISAILILVQLWLAVLVGYLLLLTLASFRAERRTSLPSPALTKKRFVVLIPAHNEERLLPDLLKSLNRMDYPQSLFDVYVVADNCTDQTASLAAQAGAIVHIRTDKENPGKGPALQWLLKHVWQSGRPVDALVILDADSLVSPDFLAIMAARLERGERVIQAYYAVRDPQRAWSSGLRYAALAVLHYLRPQGRMALGGSAGLKGNGMVFVSEILEQHQWSPSITEDIELHMELVLHGERVTFAPDALVLGEMPHTLAGSKSQHMRWERGRLEMSRRYVPQLLRQAGREAIRGRLGPAYLRLDAVMEHLIPPFSILVLSSLLLLCASLIFLAASPILPQDPRLFNGFSLLRFNLFLSAFNLLGLLVYLIAGLRSVHAPRAIYWSLLYSPVYMAWKLVQYFQAWISRGPQEWIRTSRNEG
jgi:1,2-diacylglycerol 3-beta-glucosyltransferase